MLPPIGVLLYGYCFFTVIISFENVHYLRTQKFCLHNSRTGMIESDISTLMRIVAYFQVFGVRTPSGMAKSNRPAYTQPHESFLSVTVPDLGNQDATDHNAGKLVPYCLADDANGGHLRAQAFLEHQASSGR